MVAKPSARLKVVTLPEPWPMGYAATHPVFGSFDQPDQKIFRPANFAIDLHGELGRNHRPFLGASARQHANHGRHEFVEGEDRGSGEARQHNHRATVRSREANRLARLERDSVRDNAGIRPSSATTR